MARRLTKMTFQGVDYEIGKDGRKVALVGHTGNSPDGTSTLGWYKVAKGSLSEQNTNASISFLVHDTRSYASGILMVDLRRSNDTIFIGRFGWLTRTKDIALKQFFLGINADENTWTLYYYRFYPYYIIAFEVLQEAGITTNNAVYNLYSNNLPIAPINQSDIINFFPQDSPYALDENGNRYNLSAEGQYSEDLYLQSGQLFESAIAASPLGLHQNKIQGIVLGQDNIIGENLSEVTSTAIIGYKNAVFKPTSSIIGGESKNLGIIIGESNINSQWNSLILGSSNEIKDIGIDDSGFNSIIGNYNTITPVENPTVPLHHNTLIGDSNNLKYGRYSFVHGKENEVESLYYSVIFGKGNTANAVTNFTFGADNTNTSSYSLFFGNGNSVEKLGYSQETKHNCVFGSNNQIHKGSNYINIYGHSNQAHSFQNSRTNEYEYSTFSTVLGQQNKLYESSYSFISGRANEVVGSYNLIHGTENTVGTININEIGNHDMGTPIPTKFAVVMGQGHSIENSTSVAAIGTNIIIKNADNCAAVGSHLNLTNGESGERTDCLVCGAFNKTRNNDNAAFIVGTGSSTTPKDSFVVFKDGTAQLQGSLSTGGADYAEYIKEWHDQNIEKEDRIGYMVTIKDGKLYKAQRNDHVIGVTSRNPSIIGGVQDPDTQENGAAWDCVGLRGILSVYDDGTCEPGYFCKCGGDGVATMAEQQSFETYYVVERINANMISVEVK